jgi:hypothetical protein
LLEICGRQKLTDYFLCFTIQIKTHIAVARLFRGGGLDAAPFKSPPLKRRATAADRFHNGKNKERFLAALGMTEEYFFRSLRRDFYW